MKTGLKYTQSSGKCNEQDMTLCTPTLRESPVCCEATARRKGPSPASSLREQNGTAPFLVVHGRAAYVTGRRIVPVVVWGAVRSQAAVLQNSKRSGTAEISVQMHCSKPSSSMDGCFLHSIFWRGRLFSTPAPPFRLWFCKAAAVSRTRCRLKERKEVQKK